jgi:chromosome segregation ATPase
VLQASAKPENRRLFDPPGCQSSTSSAVEDVQTLADTDTQEVEVLREHVFQLDQLLVQYSQELTAACKQLEAKSSAISGLKGRQTELHRSRDALRKRIECMKVRNAKAQIALETSESIIQTYRLRDKTGVIQPEVRDMLRKLTCQGVAAENVLDVINIVAEALGIQIVGSVSARSVARAMLEGLVQARMQLGHEISQAHRKYHLF